MSRKKSTGLAGSLGLCCSLAQEGEAGCKLTCRNKEDSPGSAVLEKGNCGSGEDKGKEEK